MWLYVMLFTTDPNILWQCNFIFHITIPFLGLTIFIYIFKLFISLLLNSFWKLSTLTNFPWRFFCRSSDEPLYQVPFLLSQSIPSETLCTAPKWTLAKPATFPLSWSYSFLESMLSTLLLHFPLFHWRTSPWRSHTIHMSERERKKLMGTSMSWPHWQTALL